MNAIPTPQRHAAIAKYQHGIDCPSTATCTIHCCTMSDAMNYNEQSYDVTWYAMMRGDLLAAYKNNRGDVAGYVADTTPILASYSSIFNHV